MGAISTSIGFKSTVFDLRKAVARGDAAADFLASAYLSWFRHTHSPVSLHAWPVLSREKRSLFERMLRLRDGTNWSESTLMELEREFEDHLRAASRACPRVVVHKASGSRPGQGSY